MSAESEAHARIALELQKIEADIELNKAATAEFDAAVKAAKAALDRAIQAKGSKDAEDLELRLMMQRKKRELEDAARAARLAEERERLLRLAGERERELDEIIAKAAWRDYAKPHQLEGAKFLAVAKRAICADEMGLGKTLQSLMTLDLLNAKRVLIICPGDIAMNFENEALRWAPERSAISVAKMPKTEVITLLDMFYAEDQFTFIINYEAWAQEWLKDRKLLEKLKEMKFDTVIMDEAHEIKTTSTVAYKGVEDIIFANNVCAVRGCGANTSVYGTCDLGHNANELGIWPLVGRSVENVIAMTGTPILNSPDEIFSLLHLTKPEMFDTKTHFKTDFCRVDFDGKITFKVGGQTMLADKLQGMYIRRTKESAGVILPDQHVIEHSIELDPEVYPLQAQILDMLKKHAQIEIEEGRATKLMQILALITRQRQASTWPGGIYVNEPMFDNDGDPIWILDPKTGEYVQATERINIGKRYAESVKMDRAIELMTEANAKGERVVVFSQFKEVLLELKRRMPEAALMTGDTKQADRDDIKRNFDVNYHEDPKWMNLFAHFQVGGVGTNFTNANVMIIMDEEWNPGKNSQAYDRINRMGQTKETTVHILRLADSIDEWMAELNRTKDLTVGTFHAAMDDSTESIPFEARLTAMFTGAKV